MRRSPVVTWLRHAAVTLVVLLIAIEPAARGARRAEAATTLEVVVPAHGAAVWIATSAQDRPEAAPRIVFLHGMCMDVRATCERARGLGADRGALACPSGNGVCGGGVDWRGDGEVKATHLDTALEAARPLLGPPAPGSDVLIGFSRGAFVARDVALARPGRYRALVLVGAAMMPDADALRAAGIQRVVLASGDFDPARRTMERAARELASRGLAARFVRLGPVGHALPADVATRLRRHLGWAAGDDDSPAVSPAPPGRGASSP